MKRKLLFGERMLHGDGNTPFNSVIPVRIRGDFSAAALNHALVRLQQKHPLLNAFIENDETNRPWFAVDKDRPVRIPVRVIPRYSDSDQEVETVREWLTPFDTAKGPMLRIVWIKGGGVSDLLMVIHHCLCDGGSAMSILAALLELLDDGDANIGQETPIKGMTDIVPVDILEDKRKVLKARFIGYVATLALWIIPVNKKAVDRQNDYLIQWSVDSDKLAALSRFCKNSGVTINTFFCTALLRAFKEVRKDKAHNKVSCPVDIRRFNPKIKRDHIFAFGLMFVVSAYPKLDFISNVKAIQKDIKEKMKKLNPYLLMMVLENAHPVLEKFTRFLKYGKSSNDCMFSNLGNLTIPYQYNTFELEMINSPSVIGPLGNTTSLVISTYRGQMSLSLVGSEGYLPYADAQAIQHKLMSILEEQLITRLEPA